MTDLASWVAYSASLTVQSASYSNSASFLIFRGMGANSNGTASFSISSSWAYLAYSASFVISASRATTSSYALTCSYFDGTISGAFSVASANTSSFLSYGGYPNGTASSAISSSRALQADTASYVSWFGNNVDNGTVYRSVSASFASTASVLVGSGGTISATASWAGRAVSASFLTFTSDFGAGNNGTASHARYAYSASTAAAVTNVVNSNIYREWGPITSSIIGTATIATTASFGYIQVSGSGAKIVVEAWGDVNVPMSSSINYSGSIRLDLSESFSAYYQLDESKFQNYYTGSDVGLASHFNTGSVIRRFYLKGYTTNAASAGGLHRYQIGAYVSNGLSFVTGSNVWSGVRCSLKVNTDNVVTE